MRLRTITEAIRVNEAISLPSGHFVVTEDFKLSPGGGWGIRFTKGDLIQYDGTSKKCTVYSAKAPDGKNIAPPIQGETNLDISEYGREPEQENMLATFQKGTKSINKKEFDQLKSKLSSTK